MLAMIAFIVSVSSLIPSATAADNKKVDQSRVISDDGCASLKSELNALQKKKTAVDRLLADYVIQARTARSDPQLVEANAKVAREYAEYRIYLMRYAERGYYWELVSSWVILALVGIVVLTGLSFSGYQLYKSFHFAVAASQFPTDEKVAPSQGLQPPPLEAQIKVSAHELQITSSVVGLIVLAFSLVFLYLFILHVYPITTPGAESAVAKSAQPES